MTRKPTAGRTITLPAFDENTRKKALICIGIISVILIFSLLWAPFYRTAAVSTAVSITDGKICAWDIFNKRDINFGSSIMIGDLFTVESIVLFGAITLLGAIAACLLFSAARKYSAEDGKFVGAMQNLIVFADFTTAAFLVASIVASAIRNAASTTTHYIYTGL